MPSDPKDERRATDAVTIGNTGAGAGAAAAPIRASLYLEAILQTGQVLGGRRKAHSSRVPGRQLK